MKNKIIDKGLLEDTKQQICRDLTLENITLQGSNWHESLKNYLAIRLEQMLQQDLDSLIAALYRLDIPEDKALLALNNQLEEAAPFALAELIITREMQKVASRRWYKAQAEKEATNFSTNLYTIQEDDIEKW